MKMQEILDFFRNCGTFYLATADGDQPRVRPFGAVCGFEGKFYIVTNNRKDVYRQMLKNGKVEMCGMYKGRWMRLAGEVELDPRREARAAMLEANKEALSSMYNADDGLMVVFRFKSGTATLSSFTEAPVTYSL